MSVFEINLQKAIHNKKFSYDLSSSNTIIYIFTLREFYEEYYL